MLYPSETGMYTPGVINEVTIPTLLGICLGGTVFLVAVAAITCVCYRKRALEAQVILRSALRRGVSSSSSASASPSDQKNAAAAAASKRPGHVKSPGSGPPPGPTLKKSPSPTGAKSPPGQKSSQQQSDQVFGSCADVANCSLQQSKNDGDVKRFSCGGQNGVIVHGDSCTAGDHVVYCTKFHTENEHMKSMPAELLPLMIKEQQDGECEKTDQSSSEKNDEMNRKNASSSAAAVVVVKLGKLHFRLRHMADKNALVVTIVRCTDLPAKDPNVGGSSDPYVKLQLLPDKQHKVKTRVLRRTLNPVYDEDFTFYGIDGNQLAGIALHFVVLSFDRYSRDDVIGEVVCPLSTVDFGAANVDHVLLSLFREISPRNLKIRSQGRGELLVSLCYQPAANRLTVVVLKARNLPKIDITGLSDPYVKIYMLYNGQRIAKKKTHVKKRTLNPVFNESFVFDVPCNEGLDNITLEFLVLDWDRVTKNEVIGRLELGSGSGSGGGRKIQPAALHHWHEVCTSPRRQIAEWHKLRD